MAPQYRQPSALWLWRALSGVPGLAPGVHASVWRFRPDHRRLRRSPTGTRSLGLLYLPGRQALFERQLTHYSEALEKLYQAIAEVTGKRLIVDSSKYPTYSYLLGLLPTIDLSIVHLVRDPRAVVHSWWRVKASAEEFLSPMSAWYAAGL